MSWYVNCANCGKQVSIDAPTSICYFCEKNATTKEITKKEDKPMVTVDERIEYKRLPMQERGKWLKDHMEAIVADIRSMSKAEVLEKWPFSISAFYKIKRVHTPELTRKRVVELKQGRDEVPPKIKVEAPEPVLEEKPIDKTKMTALTEHERFLMLLGYQQATREFLKAGKS